MKMIRVMYKDEGVDKPVRDLVYRGEEDDARIADSIEGLPKVLLNGEPAKLSDLTRDFDLVEVVTGSLENEAQTWKDFSDCKGLRWAEAIVFMVLGAALGCAACYLASVTVM